METAADLLIKVLKKRGLHKHASASVMIMDADKWIEEHVSHCKEDISVTTLKDGALHIECSHSIAAQELHGVSEQLKQYLQKKHEGLEGIRILRK